MKDFALIGTAGYVSPRHLKAIKDTGNNLIASVDPSDSVGIVDSYFPDSAFFTEFERFDRFLEKRALEGQKIDYLSICSPNYLHDAHIRYGLKMGANVICEKPVVLNPWNLEPIIQSETKYGQSVYTILQLRLIPALQELRERIKSTPTSTKHQVNLSYITPRGNWYYSSWKGKEEQSGGITTNIGIHLFDLMIWLFGPVEFSELHQYSHDRATGFLELEQAEVSWYLSINKDHLPEEARQNDLKSFRSIKMDNTELEFSRGFTELHSKSYTAILNGQGFGIQEALPSIELVHQIRSQKISNKSGIIHPFSSFPLTPHPFSK